MIKLENTKAIVEMHKEKRISFGEGVRKIHIVGDITFLDKEQLDREKLEISSEFQ